MQCLLVGNYGTGNVGDEALKEYFLHAFPEISWTVVSAHPERRNETPRLPAGIRSFLSLSWWKTVQAYRRTDAVVFGGGTLFTDAESAYACFLWFAHAYVAWFFKKPLLLAFQGVGPFRTWWGERWARFAVRHSSFLSVRDEASALRVKAWGLNIKIVHSFDPIFSGILGKKGDGTQKVLIIIPRHNSSDSFLELVALRGESDWQAVRILSLQPGDRRERDLCQRLRKFLDGVPSSIIPIHTFAELLEQVSQGSLVLTQRYHGALAALMAGIPLEILPQKDGDKLSTLVPFADGEAELSLLSRQVMEGENALREALARVTTH